MRARSERAEKPLPDCGLLYSIDDIARLSRTNRVLVVRLCLAGALPGWQVIDGRRCWDRRSAIEAVARVVNITAAVAAAGRAPHAA